MKAKQKHTNSLPGIPLVESPFYDRFFNKDTDPEILSIAKQMRNNGYAIIRFPDNNFNKKADNIKKALNDSYDWEKWKANPKLGLRVQDAWKTNDDVKSLATNKKLLDILENLYGRKPIPFQTLNFPVGTQQHFHSDSVHFSSIPERFMCGVWVALEDIDDAAGPLEYYPGTHSWPIYTNEHICRSHNPKEKVSQVVFQEAWQDLVKVHNCEKHTFKAKKGDALIWAANLLHGGAPQTNMDLTRWSQVTHYYFEDCVYYTPMLSEPFKGLIHIRNITNVCTGKELPNMCNGVELEHSFIEQSKNGINYGNIIPINDFDAERYAKDNLDVTTDLYEHYRRHGIVEGRKAFKISERKNVIPLERFDKAAYLAANKDVAISGVDAYEHYISHGIDENRLLYPV